jgi:predicted ATP-dependent endonuclease of OLD family
MKLLKKINLQNFKRFTELSLNFDDSLNILIGENESGKSTILSAIDIVLSGSRSKVENIGLENLFNTKAIVEFFTSDKRYESLPILFVELYLNDQNNPNLDGKINSELLLCNGLRLVCELDDNFSKDIKEILGQDDHNFPYEFYSINFKTFSGETYTGYRKYMKHLMLDNTQISNEYATREYVKAMYNSHVTSGEKNRHQNEYRKHKEIYKNSVLAELNDSIPDKSCYILVDTKLSASYLPPNQKEVST